MLKYTGVTCHDVCNFLASDSTILQLLNLCGGYLGIYCLIIQFSVLLRFLIIKQWKKAVRHNVLCEVICSLWNSRKVRMRVHNINKITRIYNVIGTIRGSVEPGELVDYFRHFVLTKITRVREDKF